MNVRSLPALLIALSPVSPAVTSALASPTHHVKSVEALVALAPEFAAAGGDSAPLVVKLAAGDYVLKDSIRILRSHVTLFGEAGTRLVLADGVNEPVIVVGSQAEVPAPDALITDIRITDLAIDGNKDAQSSELSPVRPWIRNNGIDVRAVHRLTVERVHVSNPRSGGLVISYGCRDVTVRDSVFETAYFDGIAFYASDRVTVTRCTLARNHAAGISLDNDFRDSVFASCSIRDNGDVGVFARHSSGLRFTDCAITKSGNWAVFLAHDDSNLGVTEITIEHCQIRNNRGGVYVGSVTEDQSRAVRVTHSTFAGNLLNGRRNFETAGVPLAVADCTEEAADPALPLAVITP